MLTTYLYEPVYEKVGVDALQRFGKVKVEATSFTISEPVEALSVAPLLHGLAEASVRRILADVYDVRPFEVMMISFERIFVDKLFAAEAYSRTASTESHAFDAAKHIYDLAVLADRPRIVALLDDDESLERLLRIRYEEERARLDGIPGVATRDFGFFESFSESDRIRTAYEKMLDVYVFNETDRIPLEDAASILSDLGASLWSLPSWSSAKFLGDIGRSSNN